MGERERSSGAGTALGVTALGAAGGAAAGGIPAARRETKIWKDALVEAKKNPLYNAVYQGNRKKIHETARKEILRKARGPARKAAIVGTVLGASFGAGYMLGKRKKAAAYKLQGRMKFQGLDISIENRKGSTRKWFDPHGNEKGSTPMRFSYGYIRKTKGTDGDHVDVYIGPKADAKMAYVIDQNKKPPGDIKKDGKAWTEFDEQKVMLGFPNAKAAKDAYLRQYDDPRFFRSLRAMTMEDFSAKVLAKENYGQKVARALRTPEQIMRDQERKETEMLKKKTRELRLTKKAALAYQQEFLDPIAMAEYQGIKLAQEYWDGMTEMEKQAVGKLLAKGLGRLIRGGAKMVSKGHSAVEGGARAAGAMRRAVGKAAVATRAGAKKLVTRGGQAAEGLASKGVAKAREAGAGIESAFIQGRRGLSPRAAKMVQAERAGIRATDRAAAQKVRQQAAARVKANPMVNPQANKQIAQAQASPYRKPGTAPAATPATGAAPAQNPMFAPKNRAIRTERAKLRMERMKSEGIRPGRGPGLIRGMGAGKKAIIGGTLAAGTGLALYGGMKGIDAAANLTRRQPAPYVAPRVPGIGRPY